jgi:hypothetical protein
MVGIGKRAVKEVRGYVSMLPTLFLAFDVPPLYVLRAIGVPGR